MKWKRVVLVAVLLLGSVIVFAACGCSSRDRQLRIDPYLSIRIRQSWIDINKSSISVDDVLIARYYGTFNGASAISIRTVREGLLDAIWEETVAGITFSYRNWTPIEIWYNYSFYTLTQGYIQGLLTVDNLHSIHSIHRR